MIDGPIKERRVSPRYATTAGVQLFHEPSKRDFPARCVNLSTGGLLMYVPAAVPVRTGQTVRLTLSQVGLPALAGLSAAPIEAKIVRVDRNALLAEGHLAVAVRFAP
jgi:hypothetical protein